MSSYNYSLTTFSKSGKLEQIENALKAVGAGVTSVGILGGRSAVLLTERKATSTLADAPTIERIASICPNIGLVYSGMGPDARILLAKARKTAETYKLTYGEYPSVYTLVRQVASIMQEYTQTGGVRPFGVSLLVAGVEPEGEGVALYQVDPSGAFWSWRASAIGKGMVNAKSFLEKRWTEGLEGEDAVHLGLLTLKEGFEGLMTKGNIEIGVADLSSGTFRCLGEDEIQDYLSNL